MLFRSDPQAFALMERLHEYFKAPKSHPGGVHQFHELAREFNGGAMGHEDFLYSRRSWDFIRRQYREFCTDPSFVDYFWTVRTMHAPVWTLARIAAEFGLPAHVKVARGQRADTAETAVLADACEAVIGALYLDGGLDVARGFVTARWKDLIAADTAPPRDAKHDLAKSPESDLRALLRARRDERVDRTPRAGPTDGASVIALHRLLLRWRERDRHARRRSTPRGEGCFHESAWPSRDSQPLFARRAGTVSGRSRIERA